MQEQQKELRRLQQEAAALSSQLSAAQSAKSSAETAVAAADDRVGCLLYLLTMLLLHGQGPSDSQLIANGQSSQCMHLNVCMTGS